MNANALMRNCRRLVESFLAAKAGTLERAARLSVEALAGGRKILLFGNGGSAAEAQHFAAELVNKFLEVRPAMRALALTTDTSVLTSVGNDAGFETVFSRQIEALGDAGDVALALSTSGGSPNVIRGLKAAKKAGLVTIGLSGKGGGKMGALCDVLIDVPSSSTPRIQEIHLLALHILAEEVEKKLKRAP